MPTKPDPELIAAAILGYQEQQRQIDSKISELRAMLSGAPAETHCNAGRSHEEAQCRHTPPHGPGTEETVGSDQGSVTSASQVESAQA